ncbi:MAG: hypothetical protein WCC64_13800 [Aliidongia sp.]
MKRRTGYNPKRQVAAQGSLPDGILMDMANRVDYGGNPEHKRSAADYGLMPPASPRPGKTLCDARGPFLKAEALKLLKAGVRKGLMSPSTPGAWPQNIWALSESGEPFEAQLENPTMGTYHGYPMPADDSFRAIVTEEWNGR